MNQASVSIISLRGSSEYLISMHCPQQLDRPTINDNVATTSMRNMLGVRGLLEGAMEAALSRRGRFPVSEANEMLNALQWDRGAALLLEARPDVIQFTMNEETCLTLPELAPLDMGSGAPCWLDALAPSYRTIGAVQQKQVLRHPEKSLAILYQEGDEFDFESMAENLLLDLADVGLSAETFPGSKLVAGQTIRAVQLRKIFREHRAVLFLGHHYRGGEESHGGWKLTEREKDALLMSDLSDYLRPLTYGSYGGLAIPEIVFAACCSSAWRDPELPQRPSLVYPKVFIDGGVEFFIGTWMDVKMPAEGYAPERDLIRRLIKTFFSRWAEDGDGAVFHLFEAKKACGFHPLTSLYQIYWRGGRAVAPPSGQAERPATQTPLAPPEPGGALLMGLETGDRLGPYKLGREMWKTPYARTFWAMSAGGRHLVQVPVDEWQGVPELTDKLEAAIAKLREAELGDDHLVPDRAEFVTFSRAGLEPRKLHALVYDLPPKASERHWRVLQPGDFARQEADHPQKVLLLGLKLSARLVELHARKIRHGNLDPGSLVFRRRDDGTEQLVVKDAWIAQAWAGRCTEPRYGAPEETASLEGSEELKTDCWGLGVILFELATGQTLARDELAARPSIRETLGNAAHPVPEALERVVKECLMPTPSLRPSAESIFSRFTLSGLYGGGYVNDFEGNLYNLIRAGHRLFAIEVSDPDELDSTFRGLTSAGCRIFVAAEGEGLTDWQTGNRLLDWFSADEMRQVRLRRLRPGEPAPPPPTADEVAAVNADIILREAVAEFQQEGWAGLLPVVVIAGAHWWNVGPAEVQLAVWRTLKLCQTEYRAPVVMVVDNLIPLESGLARSFHRLSFPLLSPTDVFEQILAFPQSSGLPVAPPDELTALELSQQLSPCSGRELEYALRLCALRHGAIDERALKMRDAQREHIFRTVRGVSYIPLKKLPQRGWLGLPRELNEEIEDWQRTVGGLLKGENVAAVPRRLLIQGPHRYGKTQLGLMLGAVTSRPVVHIDAARCLQGNLGESEREFRLALAAAASLRSVVVLLDDVDRFFGRDAPAQADRQAATVARMSGIFEQWLDNIPQAATVVMTSAEPEKLPVQWQRRVELRLDLASPFSLTSRSPEGIAYRRQVFAAIFRRAGLEALSGAGALLEQLAQETLPDPNAKPLPSPLALASGGGRLRHHTVRLETGDDIEQWVRETLLLHAERGDPAAPDFWLSKLQPV